MCWKQSITVALVAIVVFLSLKADGFSLRTFAGSLKVHPKEFFQTNGTTYVISSIMDNSVVTVHANGDVTTEKFLNSPDQHWTVVTHPTDPDALEFKQAKVPYNMLSGYEDPPENPGIFPRPLSLTNRGTVGRVTSWNIKIRGRWCLQANGFGYPMDMDDCEDFVAPWQLWEFEEVSKHS